MSNNLTESAAYDATITVPADGDTRNAASVNTAFQSLANRTKYLKGIGDASNGFIQWCKAIRWTSTSTITVSKIAALVLSSVCLTNSADAVVGSGSIEGGGAFANSTWYYIYAYNSSGSIAFQLSTTAPEASRTFKSGTTTHRYLGAIRTDGSGNILPFTKSGNQYRWFPRNGSAIWSAFQALNAGVATSRTSVSCAGLAPPHAELLSLSCMVVDGNTGAPANGRAYVYRDNNATYYQDIYYDLDEQSVYCDVEMPWDGSQVYYNVDNANIALSIWVRGWSE